MLQNGQQKNLGLFYLYKSHEAFMDKKKILKLRKALSKSVMKQYSDWIFSGERLFAIYTITNSMTLVQWCHYRLLDRRFSKQNFENEMKILNKLFMNTEMHCQ